jgi:LacI family transcriptional regulator
MLMNRCSGAHPAVRGDDELGGYLAAKHLLAQGHRRIGFAAGPFRVSTAVLRLDGYRRAHREAGVDLDESLVVESSFAVEGGVTAGGKLLGLPEPPTAIFAVNDSTALGVMAAARDLGIRVPEDLALVGYNDSEIAGALPVPLSSVALPLERIGRLAVDLLLERIAGAAHRTVVLPPRLMVRTSSGYRIH